MDGFIKHYAKQRKLDKKVICCMVQFIKNSRKFKLINSDRKQMSGCLEMGLERGHEKI